MSVYGRVPTGNDPACVVVTNHACLVSFLSVVNVRSEFVNVHKEYFINYFCLKIVA